GGRGGDTPPGEDRADRQQRQADRIEARADRLEVRAPAGVAGEVDVARRRADDEAAPEIAIAIGEAARGEVSRRNARDDELPDRHGLPPVEIETRPGRRPRR